MRPLDELLERAAVLHGHLCPGQPLGVRMAIVGCRELGIEDPESAKRLVVYVEIDRCASDAIQAATGCQLGRRTLKHIDYGKMAATFLDTKTGRAVRVVALEESREQAWAYAPEAHDKDEAQRLAYARMPDQALFSVRDVRLTPPVEDLPGHPRGRVRCALCGEGINDGRQVERDGEALCRGCAFGAYYKEVTA